MDMNTYLLSADALLSLRAIYGQDAESQCQRYQQLAARHREIYGEKDGMIICSAPGRTEIAGNHTDHNHGRVLAAAVNLDTIAAVTPNDTGIVTMHSEGYARPFIVNLQDLTERSKERETSLALIRGIAARLSDLGYVIGGFDAVVTSTVFKGSGLSSSAALEVMLVLAFDALYNGRKIAATDRARIAQYAENVYFGKPCGLLDQMASSVGGLVTMDFGGAEAVIEPLSYDFLAKGYALCVVSAGGEHGNLTAEYAAIPTEMKAVAEKLGGTVLRDIPAAEFERRIPELKGSVSDRAILRALHFYDEDARIPVLVDALKRDDLNAFFAGIIQSGESSWKLLQNLYVPGSDNQEMALALELSRRMLEGKGAWRIHGGGFAGTILAFVPLNMLDEYKARMNAIFGDNATTPLGVRPVEPSVIG